MTFSTDRPLSTAKPLPAVQSRPRFAVGPGLVDCLSLEAMQALFHEGGLRGVITTDLQGSPILGSAAGGLMFDVHPGTIVHAATAESPASYSDFTFVVSMRTGRALPLADINDWNAGHRFGRVHQDQGFLRLDFDLFIDPGVSQTFLRTALNLWCRLVGEFQQFLAAAFPTA